MSDQASVVHSTFRIVRSALSTVRAAPVVLKQAE